MEEYHIVRDKVPKECKTVLINSKFEISTHGISIKFQVGSFHNYLLPFIILQAPDGMEGQGKVKGLYACLKFYLSVPFYYFINLINGRNFAQKQESTAKMIVDVISINDF